MSRFQVTAADDLRTISFKVCTALDEAGIKAVLTGGSAAAIYAPEAYQSRNADFIASWITKKSEFEETIRLLGFYPDGRIYSNPQSMITLDFPSHEIRIGEDFISSFSTLRENGMILHVLSATDSVCDRLSHFFWYADRSALKAAIAVAKLNPVSMKAIESFADRHGEIEKFMEFEQRLNLV